MILHAFLVKGERTHEQKNERENAPLSRRREGERFVGILFV